MGEGGPQRLWKEGGLQRGALPRRPELAGRLGLATQRAARHLPTILQWVSSPAAAHEQEGQGEIGSWGTVARWQVALLSPPPSALPHPREPQPKMSALSPMFGGCQGDFAHATESPVGFHTKHTTSILCSVKAPGSQSQSTNSNRCLHTGGNLPHTGGLQNPSPDPGLVPATQPVLPARLPRAGPNSGLTLRTRAPAPAGLAFTGPVPGLCSHSHLTQPHGYCKRPVL